MSQDEPKIFIDEDWKAQVQREKEQALKATEASGEAEPAEAEAEAAEEGDSRFLVLVSSLATQAMYALGLIARWSRVTRPSPA